MHWGSVIELIHITASFGHGLPLQWSIWISHRSPSKPATQSHQNLDFSLLEVRWLVGCRCRQIPLTHGEERQGSETALISHRSPLNPFGQRHLKLFTVQIYFPLIVSLKLQNMKHSLLSIDSNKTWNCQYFDNDHHFDMDRLHMHHNHPKSQTPLDNICWFPIYFLQDDKIH